MLNDLYAARSRTAAIREAMRLQPEQPDLEVALEAALSAEARERRAAEQEKGD